MATFNDKQRAFLEANHRAAMITLKADGSPHAVRVGVAMVDGKLWSSGTQKRVRTSQLRRDPRATLFVFDDKFGYVSIDGTVTLIEGSSVPSESVKLFRTMQNRPSGLMLWNGKEIEEDAFRQAMVDEQRLIYQFEPKHVSGMV